MTPTYVPILRSFSKVPTSPREDSSDDFSEDFFHFLNKQETYWADILHLQRVVILAEAGAGKTEEMKHEAKQRHSEGKFSFFIRIESIDSNFEESFEEAGSEEEFQQWLTSSDEAWFFLDSVDEAKLESPKAFEKALKKFAKRIKCSIARSHIFITSRPYAWKPKSDTELIEKLLPIEQDGKPKAARLYILNHLSQKDIRFFAKERHVKDIDSLINEIEKLNLSSIASRPFDLELVIQKFKDDGKLESRLKMLQHTIKQMLSSHDPDRPSQYLDVDKAQSGVKLLAASATLVNQSGIYIPDNTINNKIGIEPEEILTGWKFTEINELLLSGVFNDILYGSVRFRHKEIKDLLTAEWFVSILKQDGNRRAVEDLFFTTIYGEEVIRPRLRPVLSWLILFDKQIRNRALSISPEIAVEGGDASYLSINDRKELLKKIVQRIDLQQDNRSARDNSAIARLAHIDLQECALELIQQYKNSNDVIFFLGRLIWLMQTSHCNQELSNIAINNSTGINARIASIRAVMTNSSDEGKYELWKQINDSGKNLQRSLLAEIVKNAPPTQNSINLLLNSCNKLEPYKRLHTTGLDTSLSHFIDQLKNTEHNGDDYLMSLIKGINSLIKTPPYIERKKCDISEKFCWLLPLALEVIEYFVKKRSKESFDPEVVSILLIAPKLNFWGVGKVDLKEYKESLYNLIFEWNELNDHLFWETVELERQDLASKNEKLNEYRLVQPLYTKYFYFSQNDFKRILNYIETKTLLDDKLIALTLAFDIFDEADRRPDRIIIFNKYTAENIALSNKFEDLLKLEPICETRKKWHKTTVEDQETADIEKSKDTINRSKRIQSLKENPSLILLKSDSDPNELINHQIWLLNEIRAENSNASSAINWLHLSKTFGDQVTNNFKQFAKDYWKLYQPILESEDGRYNQWQAKRELGTIGIELDFIDNPNFVRECSKDEILKTLHYITSELNDLPSWLEPLFNAYQQNVIDFILKEVKRKLEASPTVQTKDYLLDKLSNDAKWIHNALAPHLLNYLYQSRLENYDNLKSCLNIIFDGISSKEKIANLAIRKVSNPKTPLKGFWFVALICANPSMGFLRLESFLLSIGDEKAIQIIQEFLITLVGNGFIYGFKHFKDVQSPKLLANLYLLMHKYIKIEDDEKHSSGTGYTPSTRDHAQDARSKLFSLLIDIPGKETYFEILNLIKNPPLNSHEPWFKKNATLRAEQDSELKLWSSKKVAEFAQTTVLTPSNHRELFELGFRHLLELKDWLEFGNDSLAETYQKVKNETEIRKIVAYHLRQKSLNKYSCNEEQPLANEQRPDIWLELTGGCSPVPIEIKLLENWSGNTLCERLRNQLVGDYLRETTAGCGIFLLIWCGQSSQKHWKINGQKVSLSDIQNTLQNYWQNISSQFTDIETIEIVVIDLTKRTPSSAV